MAGHADDLLALYRIILGEDSDDSAEPPIFALDHPGDGMGARLPGSRRSAEPSPAGFGSRREPGPFQETPDLGGVLHPDRSDRVFHSGTPTAGPAGIRKTCAITLTVA